MGGLLRTACAAGRLASPRAPLRSLLKVKERCIPFIPTDWIFRFCKPICRDKVRYIYQFNIFSFGFGYCWVLGFAHTPFEGAGYDHLRHSPLFNYTRESLHRKGLLEENERVKVHHFYTPTGEADAEE